MAGGGFAIYNGLAFPWIRYILRFTGQVLMGFSYSAISILGFASRFSGCVFMLGFLLIGPLFVFHFFGIGTASIVFVVELAVCVFLVRRSLKRHGQTLVEFIFTPPVSYFYVHPLLVYGFCAIAFLLPGVLIIFTSGPPAKDNLDAMSAMEQIWFGMIAFLLGAGFCGLSVAKWLKDRNK